MLRSTLKSEAAGFNRGFVIPANAGIYAVSLNFQTLDPGVRRDDESIRRDDESKRVDSDVVTSSSAYLKTEKHAYICGVAA